MFRSIITFLKGKVKGQHSGRTGALSRGDHQLRHSAPTLLSSQLLKEFGALLLAEVIFTDVCAFPRIEHGDSERSRQPALPKHVW